MIGILGGTFDPIHHGHLRTALDVQQALKLSQIRFIPLRDPPHRQRPTAPAELRLAMVQAALAGTPGFLADDRELRRDGKSYTLETLRSLRREQEDEPLCLLLGNDAFRGFPRWHRPEQILELAHLLVMQRPGETRPACYPQHRCDDPARLQTTPAGLIHFVRVTQLEISATRVRGLLQRGLSPRYLLPDPVLEIIQQEGLYQ